MGESVKSWLLRQRLSNYGYDYNYFKKMGNLKTRLKSKLTNIPDSEIRRDLAKSGILGKGKRLSRVGGKVNYTTGQSFNEEMLNMLTLAGTKGKKSFWEVSDGWMD